MATSLTLSELAELIDGTILNGHLSIEFTGMAALDAATSSDISFLGNAKYLPQFLNTQAGAVIVPSGYLSDGHRSALIAVPNPSLAFAIVVKHFAAATKEFKPGIHPMAYVDPSAKLDPTQVCVQAGAIVMADAIVGNGTKICSNAVIQESAMIGENCEIGSNVSVRERCVIQNRVILQPGAVIGSDGYGYEFTDGKHQKIEQVGIVEIHDDVEIGANTTIDRARFGKTIIGEGTKIDNLCQIAHNVVIGKHCLIISQTGLAGSCRIGDYVTIAAQAGVAGHVTIGDKAILTARTGATTDLAGDQIYSGKPALPITTFNKLKAHARRLPKLLDRVKALEAILKVKTASS